MLQFIPSEIEEKRLQPQNKKRLVREGTFRKQKEVLLGIKLCHSRKDEFNRRNRVQR